MAHVSHEPLLAALGFAVRKRLAGTDGDLTVDKLVAWVRAGRCPDAQWRGTVRELLWEMDAAEFGGLLWHPELTPKQVGDFVRSTGAHLPVFPGFRVPNLALVDMLRLHLPDEDWPENARRHRRRVAGRDVGGGNRATVVAVAGPHPQTTGQVPWHGLTPSQKKPLVRCVANRLK